MDAGSVVLQGLKAFLSLTLSSPAAKAQAAKVSDRYFMSSRASLLKLVEENLNMH